MTTTPDPDLTLAQVAQRLNIPLKTARKLRAIGAFPNSYNVTTSANRAARGQWRVPVDDVDAFKRARRAA